MTILLQRKSQDLQEGLNVGLNRNMSEKKILIVNETQTFACISAFH